MASDAYAPGVTAVGQPGYEKLRTRFFNDRLPSAQPAEIVVPTTTAEVSRLILNASSKGTKVGVRSGGHLFPALSLVENGLLIDTSHLNRTIDYNAATKIFAFGPAVTVREAAESLTKINRFFPFGHHPSVGLCGFTLAGGQGWFVRGWGYTADQWIEQIEVVMPSGEISIASREQHPDVFWAARGAGQGFFGVVTRLWGRTIPAKTLYERIITLDATKDFQSQLKWMLETCDLTPKYGIDIAIATYYSDMLEPGEHWDTNSNELVLMAALTAYADSVEEAKTMTSSWDRIPDVITPNLLGNVPVRRTSWNELFAMQDIIFPPKDRWQADSILTGKNVSSDKIASLSTKVMCDLPNRKSIGTICVTDYSPDEFDQCLSLPHRYYVSTMTRWQDEAEDVKMSKWMREAYEPLEEISVGQYIADFDVNQRMSKVMTDTAVAKWLLIREKWDPQEMFVGYRGFTSILNKKREEAPSEV